MWTMARRVDRTVAKRGGVCRDSTGGRTVVRRGRVRIAERWVGGLRKDGYVGGSKGLEFSDRPDPS